MSKSWFNYCLDYFMPCVLRDVHLYFLFFIFLLFLIALMKIV